MNRRGFIGSILAAAVAPAIVRADSLMRIVPRETTILLVGPAGGRAIYIAQGATGLGTGASWADAFTSIQTAFAASNAGDTIWFAEGSYA
jgi:hypothetical protein